MKLSALITTGICLLLTFCPDSYAITPEQNCHAEKSIAAGQYAECRFRAESGLPNSVYATPKAKKRRCQARFEKNWQRIINKTTTAGAVCYDAPLTSADFVNEIDAHIDELATAFGKSVPLRGAVKRCRGVKNIISGRYEMCGLRNESRFIKHEDSVRYNDLALRCETLRKTRWELILAETEDKGAVCFNDSLSEEGIKSLIDEHVSKITDRLAGRTPVAITLTGSPLALTVEGAAGDMIITNTSTRWTVSDVVADFSGTALEGNITEIANTCDSVAPGASCMLSFAPGNLAVPPTDFVIQGSNTLPVTAAISIANVSLPTISVSGAPLTLTANGMSGDLTITNTSLVSSALNITSNLTGTALDGNLTETGNTCASLAPGASCSLTFTPGSTVVPVTNFTIQGSNTLPVVVSLGIESGSTIVSIFSSSGSSSGGAGVTLTGTGLTGATAVSFGGIPATAVNVINSTTVTVITPAHPVGVVDVTIDTPAGGATVVNGYTYLTTAIGQATSGGTISCLNGGLSNLVAATVDNSTYMPWGGYGTAIGSSAQSSSDGASNTAAIVSSLGNNGGTPYAAQLCNNYEVDSQGNTPCQIGNACYNDWFLPARNQLDCLFINRASIGGFSNAEYWSSTEDTNSPTLSALLVNMTMGSQLIYNKDFQFRARCVRSFTP